jgi:hypothetical protein
LYVRGATVGRIRTQAGVSFEVPERLRDPRRIHVVFEIDISCAAIRRLGPEKNLLWTS